MDLMSRYPGIFPITIAIILLVATAASGCFESETTAAVPRADAIPADVVKVSPETDEFVPIVHNPLWEQPVPMEGPINTLGAEDSPFITPDGNTFYFFFTPDVRVPVEKQIIDGVTGVYWSKKVDGAWTEPERLFLHDDASLDGCICIQGDTMWFASVRAGNIGTIDIYTASSELPRPEGRGFLLHGQHLHHRDVM